MSSKLKLMLSILLVCTASTGTLLAQQFPGSISITDKTGDDGKGRDNFENPGDVYLDGGPESKKSPGLPDGTYYFQVTNPSGNKVLSTDDAVCRQILVTNGRFAGATGPCPHANGSVSSDGSRPVQLAPFMATPNEGGEYKAWLIRKTNSTSISSSDPRVINFTQANAKTENFKIRPLPVPPIGSCLAASPLSVMAAGKSVVSYVARGSWTDQIPEADSNVVIVEIEGNSLKQPLIVKTQKPVNSCASNSVTGQTVCTTNETDVYVISGTEVKATVQSSASSQAMFFAPSPCMNCGVTMDPILNKAVVGLGLQALAPSTFFPMGFQLLDLGRRTPAFEPAFVSQTPETQYPGGFPDMASRSQISEGFLSDPLRNLILSPNEHGTYEIVKLFTVPDKDKQDKVDGDDKDKGRGNDKDGSGNSSRSYPIFFEKVFNDASYSAFGSAAADCLTGIALATRINDPTQPAEQASQVFIADLTQGSAGLGATPTSATASNPPTFTWDAPSRIQVLDESVLVGGGFRRGANGIAVAQGSYLGIVTPEGGGSQITAIELPKASGAGVPKITDWVTCTIPGFMMGYDPRPVTAYQSPNTGEGMAILGNFPGDRLAVVNLTQMLKAERVAKTGAGSHTCKGPMTTTTNKDDRSAMVRFVAVP